MIQSVLPSLGASPAASPAAPLEALLQLAASPAQAPDFSVLLAQSAVPAVVSDRVTSVPAQLPAGLAEPAPVAEFTPQPGNPLPPVLPDIAASLPPLGDIPTSAEEQPELNSAQPELLQTPIQAAPPARSHQSAKSVPGAARALALRCSGKTAPLAAELNPAKSAAALLASEPVPPVAADPLRAEPQLAPADPPALLVPTLLPAPAPAPSRGAQAVPSEPAILPEAPVKASPRPVPAGPANPEPAAQAAAQAAPQAAFRRAAAAPIAPQPGQPDLPPAAPPQVPRAPGLLRLEIAVPGAVEPAVKALDKVQPAVRRAIIAELLAPVPVPGSPDAAALQGPAALVVPAMAASPRPHDFAALVDRLVAAREAVQPQTATLTVAHAEFGQVELRFRHEPRGLAVSLTSADPDFARAAAVAAAPLNLPVSAASFVTAETSQSAPARDNTSSAGGSAGGSARGQQSERRGETAQQFNHSPRGGATRDAARRSGIFA